MTRSLVQQSLPHPSLGLTLLSHRAGDDHDRPREGAEVVCTKIEALAAEKGAGKRVVAEGCTEDVVVLA